MLGEHLKVRRLELGLTQAELARQLGVVEDTVLNWEAGHTTPRIDLYGRIVAFLGLDPIPPSPGLPGTLKAFRRRHGLSQVRAARLLGVKLGTWEEWETRRRGLGTATLDLAARILANRPADSEESAAEFDSRRLR
jgi:transcriptional regulator with XRE-family HTH domain